MLPKKLGFRPGQSGKAALLGLFLFTLSVPSNAENAQIPVAAPTTPAPKDWLMFHQNPEHTGALYPDQVFPVTLLVFSGRVQSD